MGMRTFQTQSQPAHRGAASSSLHKLNMSPLSTASITMAALLILTVPVCKSAPTELQQATTDQRQLLSQIDALCSSYLSADLKLWKSDILGELCVLMLVQKSKELKVRENSKRTPLLHPLLHLLSQLHTRGEKGLFSMHEDIHGPGGSRAEVTFSIGHGMEDGP